MFILFRKEFSSLRAASQDAENALAKIKHGSEVLVEFKRSRNLPWLRKYWVLMDLVAKNFDGHYSKETIHELVKIRTGYVEIINTIKGEVQIPKSISFASMNQSEWEEYWERAIGFICEEVLPTISREDLEREIQLVLK